MDGVFYNTDTEEDRKTHKFVRKIKSIHTEESTIQYREKQPRVMLAVDDTTTTNVALSSWSSPINHSRHRYLCQNGYVDCFERREEHHHLIMTKQRSQSKRIDIESEEQKLRCTQNQSRSISGASAATNAQKRWVLRSCFSFLQKRIVFDEGFLYSVGFEFLKLNTIFPTKIIF
jgi:hypothetical protein